MKCAMLRVEGVFLFHIEPGDLDGYGGLTSAAHDRIVDRFIADNPGLDREELEIVDVEVVDEDDRDV